MSPALAKKRVDRQPDAVSFDAMAEAMARRQAEYNATRQRQLDAYRRVVELEAKREPIPAEVADAALSAASDLGLPHSRMAADVKILRELAGVEQRRRDIAAKAEEWTRERDSVRDRLREIERERGELMAKAQRASNLGLEAGGYATAKSELVRRAPHLFTTADKLTTDQWTQLRSNG